MAGAIKNQRLPYCVRSGKAEYGAAGNPGGLVPYRRVPVGARKLGSIQQETSQVRPLDTRKRRTVYESLFSGRKVAYTENERSSDRGTWGRSTSSNFRNSIERSIRCPINSA